MKKGDGSATASHALPENGREVASWMKWDGQKRWAAGCKFWTAVRAIAMDDHELGLADGRRRNPSVFLDFEGTISAKGYGQGSGRLYE